MRARFALSFALVAGCSPSPTVQAPRAGPTASVSEPPPDTPVSSGPVVPPPATGSPSGPGDTHFPGARWVEADLGVAVPDGWRACSQPADCVLVATTCCDVCNGGKTVAVNGTHQGDVNAKYPKQCAQVACTERGCFTRANCAAGRCVFERETTAP
jgi:hypothetical protein